MRLDVFCWDSPVPHTLAGTHTDLQRRHMTTILSFQPALILKPDRHHTYSGYGTVTHMPKQIAADFDLLSQHYPKACLLRGYTLTIDSIKHIYQIYLIYIVLPFH
jgi:hypothetical protein